MNEENPLREALTMTGCKDLADLIDMANVGRSTMDRMADVIEHGPLKGWSPADDPSEIITDLANALDEAQSERGRLSAILQRTPGLPDETVLIPTGDGHDLTVGDLRALIGRQPNA